MLKAILQGLMTMASAIFDPASAAAGNPHVVTPEGFHCLALVAFTEARNQGEIGMALTIQSVLTRKAHPAYPDTACAVAHQRSQYDGITRWKRHRTPPGRIDPKGWRMAVKVTERVLTKQIQLGQCAKATHFYNPAEADPYWARHPSFRQLCHVNDHRFMAQL
jgi:spore germination cell wall hydrolase CwlJ-like protein